MIFKNHLLVFRNRFFKFFFTFIAFIGFNVEDGEWKTGKIYYLNEHNIIHKMFDLARLQPPIDNTKTLFFSAGFERQLNFFTIKVNNKSINLRLVLPLTYSVVETQDGYPCCGKAILQKIEKNDLSKKLYCLLNKKIGIEPGIINFLHFHKYVLGEKVQDKFTLYKSKQTSMLKDYTGLWIGAYFRLDFGEKKSADKGGLCKFVFHLKESGLCLLYYDRPEAEKEHCYNGFIELPNNNNSLMKISFEYLNNNKTHRIFCFLKSGSISEKIQTYSGVMSGWTNGGRVYSSTFYMEHNVEVDDWSDEEIIAKIGDLKPGRIPKTKMPGHAFSEIENRLIKALKVEENDYLSKYGNCMPAS